MATPKTAINSSIISVTIQNLFCSDMAFNFNWSNFNETFIDQVKGTLEDALNNSPRPDIVADQIEVFELNLGNTAPDLTILEIGDLAKEKFRGILKLTYEGDAYIVLRTQVQVNPVQIKSEISIQARRGILAAHQPLIVPMLLRISNLHLNGIISLTVSPLNGITFVFKNDPLHSIEVSSNFDNLGSVKELLQNRIEETICNVLQHELPQLIHSFSSKLKTFTTPNSNSDISNSPTPASTPKSSSLQCLQDLSDELCFETISLPDLRSPIKDKHDLHSVRCDGIQNSHRYNLPRRNYSFHQLPGLMNRFDSASTQISSPKFNKYEDHPHLFTRRSYHQQSSPSKSPFQSSSVYLKAGPIPFQTNRNTGVGLKGLLNNPSPKKNDAFSH